MTADEFGHDLEHVEVSFHLATLISCLSCLPLVLWDFVLRTPRKYKNTFPFLEESSSIAKFNV